MAVERKRVREAPARIVQAYFAAAHLALAVALAAVVWQPGLLTEFFYRPRTIAVVHLVTLGWVSGSIFGSLYALGPIVWRVEMPARRLDWVAYGLWLVSASGMVVHFWINEYNGMTWAAATMLGVVALLAWRLVPRLASAHLPFEHRAPVLLAFLNFALAASLGVALGMQKLGVIAIPGPPLGSVYGHAHLAALGWVVMMILGAGYRLLPMFLPAPMPRGLRALLPVVVLECAVLLLATGLSLDIGGLIVVGAVAAAMALVLFLGVAGWMMQRRRQPPAGLRMPDLAMVTTLSALLNGGIAIALGLAVVLVGDPALRIRLAAVYGVFGIVGFLAQIVIGIGGRLLPLTVWTQAFIGNDYRAPGVPLHQLVTRPVQALTAATWALGVPVLAAGIWFNMPALARAGAALLLAGTVAEAANRLAVDRRARAPVRDSG